MCLDFINSEFRDFRGRWVRDDLQRPGWLEQFLDRWGLQVERATAEAPLNILVALRGQLRSLIEALDEGQFSDREQAALNAVLLKMPLSRRLAKHPAGYQLEMVPLRKDWDWVQAEVAASLAQLLVYQDPRRLKVCANSNCRWVFYDESKSRTRLYCSTDKCANLLKARRFRTRHRNNSS